MSYANTVLVTGATGYIGGRLVGRLLNAGYRVRCLTRSPKKLDHRPWFGHQDVEIMAGDAGSATELERAMQGCFAAYYLIHSMQAAGADYGHRDRELARIFVRAADRSDLQRIVYLGGLGETGSGLSKHLRSRREVEHILAECKIPVTVFRAAMIIGSGSASFEILRYLVERLPVMITPKWVVTRVQPIAVRNALYYLVKCLEVKATRGRTFDIGGPDVVTYAQLIQCMAEVRGLRRRWIIPIPLLSPGLSSIWIHLVTPISKEMARPLAEGLRNEVLCRNREAEDLMPQRLFKIREAMDRAFQNLNSHKVETAWSAAGPMPGDPDWSGGKIFEDQYKIDIQANPQAVFKAVCRIGGGHGWYGASFLWRLRGAIDRLFGGPGLRRGRRHPEIVAYGEALDFWRVTDVENPKRLVLHAEMKVPGRAQLRFDIETLEENSSRLIQTARFVPRGLFGLLYWYAVWPFHYWVFGSMLKGIRRSAER
ncbi:MAG: SDR family NAD(P)-dependent oxidoreductase [Planctomycetota bacterium]|nr:MAG: SDR family NAD(P)-dependent oxidoreductase [Planctomycetota bacterium]